MNPALNNTTSSAEDEIPRVGAEKAPPELISSVDGSSEALLEKVDSAGEGNRKMGEDGWWGNGQKKKGKEGGKKEKKEKGELELELEVGEMHDTEIKVEPLRRTGEDVNTMRARLLCPFFPPRFSPPSGLSIYSILFSPHVLLFLPFLSLAFLLAFERTN